MDRFEAMSMLVTVTETGSLSAAARALKVPLATLSRKITDLEALLGTRLLIRTTRKLTLTDAGMAYVAAARRILEQVEEAEREAAGNSQRQGASWSSPRPSCSGDCTCCPQWRTFWRLLKSTSPCWLTATSTTLT
jgi:DNA-binding transcriptional LysR family regulator